MFTGILQANECSKEQEEMQLLLQMVKKEETSQK